ncbi:MAG: lysine decarboxylase [Burkholderiales bacterium]
MTDAELFLDRRQRTLRDGSGRRYDLATRAWIADEDTVSGARIDRRAAVGWLQRESGGPRREPVAVVGGHHASTADLAQAAEVGRALADLGLVVLCGGRGGVMRAVCEGVAERGGLSIGLLPGETIDDANAAVSVAIATGIGFARNALIARAALCIVAIGGSYGTLSEIAYGMQFGKAIFALPGTPPVDGVAPVASVDAAIDGVARIALGLAGGRRAGAATAPA